MKKVVGSTGTVVVGADEGDVDLPNVTICCSELSAAPLRMGWTFQNMGGTCLEMAETCPGMVQTCPEKDETSRGRAETS